MLCQRGARRAIRCVTALSVAGVLSLSGVAPYISALPVAAYADTATDLAAAREELSAIGAEYQQLQRELQEAGAALENTAYEIETTQQELASAQALLAGNVSSDYKSGSVNLFDILLSSADFNDLIARVVYVTKVNDAQADAIEKVKDLQASLTQQQREQEQALADTQAKVDEQAANQERAAALVSSLSAEVQAELQTEAAEDENLAAGVQSAEDASNGASNVPITGDNSGSASSGSGQPGGTSGSDGGGNAPSDSGSTGNGGNNSTVTPDPDPQPGGGTGGGSATVSSPVAYALEMAGQPYVYGGESLAEGGFDCSGLTYYAYQQIGITLPRTAGDQLNYFRSYAGRFTTNVSELQYGDLVFFPGHVAFYVGNGQVFGATRPGQVAGYGNISWYGTFLGGGQL